MRPSLPFAVLSTAGEIAKHGSDQLGAKAVKIPPVMCLKIFGSGLVTKEFDVIQFIDERKELQPQAIPLSIA